jgi:hypothetical protein
MPAPPPESEPAIVHTIGGGRGSGGVDGDLVLGLVVLVLAIIPRPGLCFGAARNPLASVQRRRKSVTTRRRRKDPRSLQAMERCQLVVQRHATRLCVCVCVCACVCVL